MGNKKNNRKNCRCTSSFPCLLPSLHFVLYVYIDIGPCEYRMYNINMWMHSGLKLYARMNQCVFAIWAKPVLLCEIRGKRLILARRSGASYTVDFLQLARNPEEFGTIQKFILVVLLQNANRISIFLILELILDQVTGGKRCRQNRNGTRQLVVI
jgi:hypothetical protein